MEIDDPLQSNIESVRKKSETLKTLTTAPKNPISSSISKLSSSSRVLPTEKDFHFYYNFNEFKSPIDEIAAKSQSMLRQIGSAKGLWGGKEIPFVDDVEEESYDWVVNVNDEVVERFDVSCDEFSTLRKAEENAARGAGKLVDESGFELVCGKKMKAALLKGDVGESVAGGAGVRVVERDRKTGGARPKLPFHIPTIRKPQDEFNIIVNNANQPFQHVWLERSEDGSRFIHPLEKLSASDFVDTNIEVLEPMKPPALEDTPFKMVEDVKDLKELAAKLRGVNEFAVDLEHNQYRSFQGLTCLMQISTRTEDFVVDTLKLKIHVGPYLREVFKDPTKKKVMHGADRDIEWLQRDFGIYVCNLFDTGQASRVLQMERYSLEHLLQHFCGVSANKEYQNADWRLRPLPLEMLRYAREDTHYLLYIFDLMRVRLVSESTDPENSNALLLEVYQRSYDLCSRLYEKELLTDTSYLYIYGVQAANLNAQQLSVVAGLSAWRDGIARREDESTGYVLPNKLLLEIAKQMPLTTNQLKRLIKSKHPHVERNLGSVISVIRLSVQNASSFEAVAEQLKEGRIQVAPDLTFGEDDFPELQTAGDNSEGYDGSQHEVPSPLQSKEEGYKFAAHNFELTSNGVGVAYKGGGQNGNMRNDTTYGIISKSQSDQLAFPSQKSEINVAEATVQVLKKPGRAFGALLGNPASKKKVDLKKEDDKLQQIKSSVNLPFYSFSHKDQETENLPKQVLKEQNRSSDTLHSREYPFESASSSKSEDIILLDGDQHSDQVPEEPNIISGGRQAEPASSTKLDDVILLDSDSNDDEEPDGSLAGDENHKNTTDHQVASEPELVVLDEDEDDGNEPVSLSDLSSSFQKCLQSANEDQTCKQVGSIPLQFTPFDYEAARKQIEFGEDAEKRLKTGDDEEKKLGKKKVVTGRSKQDEAVLPQGKRRQAFPTSGNRSATFR